MTPNQKCGRRWKFAAWGMTVWFGLISLASAGLLSSSTWTAKDVNGIIRAVSGDNELNSGFLLQSTQSTVRCVLDFGLPTTVHRVFVTSTEIVLDPDSTAAEMTSTQSVTVLVRLGQDLANLGAPITSRVVRSKLGRELNFSAALRFPPTSVRYVVLDVERGPLRQPWNIGEIEVYGWAGDRLSDRRDVVLLDNNAPAPLRLAAEELSYYLGELAGYPVPVARPDQAALYTGNVFRVVDLKPLAQSYEQMTNNLAQGLLPTVPVNVEREGREIIFRAWPYRNVLWSVWEFLDRQGIKWVFPDAHGDSIPTGRGINLEVAPLYYTPSSDFIYANFGVEYLRDDPDAFLHFWRNRWTHTWGGHQRDVFGGSEVPAKPLPYHPVHPDHVEGFDGYPHNFKNVIPERILAQHPEWCGMLTNQMWADWLGENWLGQRLLPSQNWTTFDLTNPQLRQFVITKAVDFWTEQQKYFGDIFWMLPEDSILFSEDPVSVSQRQPLRDDPVPFAMPYPYSVSGDYYDFICGVASGIQTAIPGAKVGALAYSNTHLPPQRGTFPSNVLVDICMYGARNLPLSSPKNAEMRDRLLTWSELASHRRHYDYDLIHSETGSLPMPVPLISAIEDRARFFQNHQMMAGGTQADFDTLPFNPWNYYAYPRFYWNLELSAASVLQEFFPGYYREAAAPMQSYYSTVERYLIANNVSLQARGYDYGMVVGAYPINVLKKLNQHLQRAESLASYWVTRQRVQQARQGLDWILAQRGLSYDDLGSVDAFQRVGPDHQAVIDLRTASIQTAGQELSDGWFMFSWAQVGDYIYFEKPGRYQITFQAGIGYPDSAVRNRQMHFHIGALEYGPFTIDHESFDTYTLIVEVPAGIMEVAVEDLYNDGPFKVGSIYIQYIPNETTPVVGRLSRMAPLSLQRIFDYAAEGNPADHIDSDWDGASDLHEILAGTDELDPESFFAAQSFLPTPAGLCLRWPSVKGKSYALYRSSGLDQAYELIASDLPATPPENMYADAQPVNGAAFYQIAVY